MHMMQMARKLYYMLALLLSAVTAWAQTVPSPREHFGFNIGDDYQLANYTQTAAYFQKLAASDRVKLTDIGLTEEGRHQYMLVISSPANIRQLDQYKQIAQQLARAEGLTPEQARQLADKGKAVVWIDGGLHATEVVGTHQLIETAWQLISRNDAETMRILDNVIVLMAHANPDGQELTSNWYMRHADTLKRSTAQLPVLYQKYIGHDNNRDFYIMNMKESANMGRQLFLEWMPQIMYNHHQRGPEGSVLAGPPYRDPFNYFFDPLMITGIDALGAAMYNRLNTEDKPGYTRLNGSSFSTWYNGGLRTTTQYHNMIGLLTEIIGSPTPEKIPVVPQRLIPNGATPNPVRPQADWRFRTSIDYSVSLNYAVLDYAARQRDQVLYNIYKMGKNAIDKGNTDSWTLSPKHAAAITAAYKKEQKEPTKDDSSDPYGWSGRGSNIDMQYYDAVYKNPAERDPRGYIIPAAQPDFPTAVKFVNALIKAGIAVEKATAAFTVAGKQYPANSYIVRTNQAFRPHVLDMFEPQDHPNDFQYPGGPPIRPYDAAGWTLAFQMGVRFDRILDDFSGPFQQLPYGELQSPVAFAFSPVTSGGYLLSTQVNNAFIAVNNLMKAGVKVYRLPEGAGGEVPGTFFVPAGAQANSILKKAAAEWGVVPKVVSKRPKAATVTTPLRIALWDTYGGSMPSGWTRWLMEQYHFPFTLVYPKDIDAGSLKQQYDVIVFVTRAIPPVSGEEGNRYGYRQSSPDAQDVPEQYRHMLGRMSKDSSIPALKAFLEEGGTVITIGSSTNLAYHLGLPVHNALVEKDKDGREQALPGTKYFVPGSILQVAFDSTRAIAWGMPAMGDVNFDNSPVFRLDSDAAEKGVHPVAWFTTDKPLRSGWAWGQSYLKDGVAAFEASVGKGKLYAFGPEITFRAQPHGTFKLLFNGLYGIR
jgi:hypothetical protein